MVLSDLMTCAAQSTAIHAAQIKILQRVAHEVSSHKAEQPRVKVVIVADSCRDQISHGAGSG